MLWGSRAARILAGSFLAALCVAVPSSDASLVLGDPYPGGSTFVDAVSFGNTFAYDEMVIHITDDDGFGPFADPALLNFSDASWSVVSTSPDRREVSSLGNTVMAGGWLAYTLHFEGTPDHALELSFAFYEEGQWVDGTRLEWILGNPDNPFAPDYWAGSLLTQDEFDPGSARMVPEPATLTLTGLGLGLAGLNARRRRRQAA